MYMSNTAGKKEKLYNPKKRIKIKTVVILVEDVKKFTFEG